MACAHKKQKKDAEIWYIDAYDVVLFRQIKNGKEQIIPIKNNESMRKFTCMNEEDFYELVLGTLSPK